MSAPLGDSCCDLNPSKLGTKEHWDETYTQEMSNFEDSGDIGDVWYGEQSMYRVVRWLEECSEVSTDQSVLDLGCGNGAMLVELASKGFTDLTGIDYCEMAIQLARSVAMKEDVHVKFEVCDILRPGDSPAMRRQYDVLIDKGTYDSINLNFDCVLEKRELYIQTVCNMVKDNGMFVMSSCNWTKEEISSHFEKKFYVHHQIPTPTFQFGGKTGSNLTSLVFKKILADD